MVSRLGAALAMASAALACSGPAPEPDEAPAPLPSWMQQPPPGCAIGFSGPTLDPGDSIRYARRDAVSQLISSSADTAVRIESLHLVSSAGQRGGEFTRQDLRGTGRRVRVIAMWAEKTVTARSRVEVRHVYSLACRDGVEPPDVPAPLHPDWVLNVPVSPTRACALAVGGPTYYRRDQEPSALRDGRRALADALESRLHQILLDSSASGLRVAETLEATERAVAAAEAADGLEESWRDEDGVGPLALEGVLYGLVCVPL